MEVKKLIKLGFTRKDVFDLIRKINLNEQNSENEEERLVEFLHELSGYKSIEFIDSKDGIRFPNEPENTNEFISFIRAIAIE